MRADGPIYWDHEGNARESFKRLSLLGAYRGPTGGLPGAWRATPTCSATATAPGWGRTGSPRRWRSWAPRACWFLDSVGKAGGATDSSREFYEWHLDHRRAVPLGGHLGADWWTIRSSIAEGRPLGAIGSQARHAETDVGLFLEGEPWKRTTSGRITVRLEKDRYSDTLTRSGETLAVMRGTLRGDAFGLSIDPPEATERGEPTDSEALERDVVVAVLASGGYGSTVKLAQAVGRRKEDVIEAARRASERGAIRRVETGRGVRYEPPSEPEPEADPEPETLL